MNNYQSVHFSIIMPIWNRSEIVPKAIESVLNQTYQNYELIIIDDGSDDNLEEVISPYLSTNINLYRIPHRGVSSARNFGLKHANGEYVAYLDSDNTWYPQFLSVMGEVLNIHRTAKAAYCKYNLYKKIPIINKMFLRSIKGEEFNFQKLLKRNYIDLNTFVHAKECIETIGFFDETLTRLVDWDYIIRITAMYEPVFVPEVLVNYYLNICDVSIANTEREDVAKEAIRKKSSIYQRDQREKY